jgi:hypothetical protein
MSNKLVILIQVRFCVRKKCNNIVVYMSVVLEVCSVLCLQTSLFRKGIRYVQCVI